MSDENAPEDGATLLRRALPGVALLLILVAATAARFVSLGTQPGGLFPDEAAEGLSALRILHGDGFPVWFTDDGGREALFAYIVAAAFFVLGPSVTVLRGVAAGIGVAAVAATYVALRRFSRGTALFGSLWAAGSMWLIAVSRDGMRNIICVLVGTLALAALMRWYDAPRRRTAVAAGAVAGLGLWTYQPLKLMPVLIVLWLWLLRRRGDAAFPALRGGVVPAVIAYVVVAAPMLFIAVTNPSNYFGRGTSVIADSGLNNGGVVTHTLHTLGQLFIWGDPNARHDVAALPLLGIPLTLVFAAGVLRLWRGRSDGASLLVLLGIGVFLVPPLVAVEGGAPHFLRNLGEAPYVAAGVALGCIEIVEQVRSRFSARAAAAAACVLALTLTIIGASGVRSYVARGPEERYTDYSFDTVAAASAVASAPGSLVIISDYSAMTIRFIDFDQPPVIVEPGTRVDRISVYTRLVALSRDDIATAAGDDDVAIAMSRRAVPIAWDGDGTPRVFAVIP